MLIYLCTLTVIENETFTQPPPPVERWISDLFSMNQNQDVVQWRMGTKDGALGDHIWSKDSVSDDIHVIGEPEVRQHGALAFSFLRRQKTTHADATTAGDTKRTLSIKKLSEKLQNGSFTHYFVNNSFYKNESVSTPTFNYTILPAYPCVRKAVDEPEVFLLTLIFSWPSDFGYRFTLRRTWLAHNNVKGYRTVSLFVLGRHENETLQEQIVQESLDYHDIIQGDFIDSFRNQSYKLLMGLRWVSSYCQYAKFIMKLDNRTLPVYSNIVPQLENTSEHGGVCLGYNLNDTDVIRDGNSPLYTTKSELKNSKYPPHPSGSGYIFPASSVNHLLSISHHVEFFIWENVYISILLNTIGMGFDHVDLFEKPVNQSDPDPCVIEEAMTLRPGANFTSEHILDIWKARARYTDSMCNKAIVQYEPNLNKIHDHDLFNG
ncbi:beta-1,3-galactosyltransferase 5-like [Amphiura filiformis]|uniref:beta-1,3-galactosyltransferase 5-like n=1 Tax=Amphiura filiformis TaxID=82378 RepID=UPI003B20E42F